MYGLLNLDKPQGWTSRDVVNRIGRLVGKRVKVGHAGTLDPLATGVLVVCVGPATRLVPWIHDHSKSYLAGFQFGLRSDTDDITGQVETVARPELTAANVESCLPEFIGMISQIPPAYSAIKVNGKRAYAAARQGENVTLQARDVAVHGIEMVAFDGQHLRLNIECGSGTYIRSIGRDLARRLGTEAVMTDLVRTRIGTFSVDDAWDVASLNKERVAQALRPPLEMLTQLPPIQLGDEEISRLGNGQVLAPNEKILLHPIGATLALLNHAGELFAIGERNERGLAPKIVLLRPEC